MKIFLIIFLVIIFITVNICILNKTIYCFFFEKDLDRMWKFIYKNINSFQYKFEVNGSKYYQSSLIKGELIIFKDNRCAFFDENQECYTSFHPLSKKVMKILLNK